MIGFDIVDANDFYNMNEEKQKKYINNVKEEIKRSSNKILKKMENIVKRNVSYFQSDFYVHDLHMIKNNPGHFIWMTRETGTDFIPLESVDEILMSWYNAVKHTNEQFYFCDGKTLKKLTFDEMEKIVNKYKKD